MLRFFDQRSQRSQRCEDMPRTVDGKVVQLTLKETLQWVLTLLTSTSIRYWTHVEKLIT